MTAWRMLVVRDELWCWGNSVSCRAREVIDLTAPSLDPVLSLDRSQETLFGDARPRTPTLGFPCPRFPVQGEVATFGTRDVTHFQNGSFCWG